MPISPPSTLTLPVMAWRDATPRSRILRLDLGGTRFSYRAGQAVMLGMHGQPLQKPYSIAGPPEQARRRRFLEFLVQVDAHGMPGAHLDHIRVGARVDLQGPLGSFQFPADVRERHVLFIAGGTGIAPLRAMLWQALHQLRGRPVTIGVVYSARTPTEFAYQSELRRLSTLRRIELSQTVTRAGEDPWTGHRGRIDAPMLEAALKSPSTLCLICGPPSLVAEIPSMLRHLDVAADHIRMEVWG